MGMFQESQGMKGIKVLRIYGLSARKQLHGP